MPLENNKLPETERNAMMDTGKSGEVSLLKHLISGKYEEEKRRQLQSDASNGVPCKRCGDQCQGGLDIHHWRKICKNCNCKIEDHAVELQDSTQALIVQNLFTASDGTSTLDQNLNSSDSAQQAPRSNEEDRRRAMSANTRPPPVPAQQSRPRLPSEPSDSEYLKTKAAKKAAEQEIETNRQKQMMKQLPPHDTDPSYCHDLSDVEKEELLKFADNLKKNAIGKGVMKKNTDTFSWVCTGCNGSIPPETSAVFADRAGPVERWHPECFKCNVCNEKLVDLIYFYDDGKLFCGRHFAEKFRDRCAACDELIFEPNFTEAEGKSFHRRHFVCYTCEKNLAGEQYVSHKSQPYCMHCYHKKHANTCIACHTIIVATSLRISNENRHWHATPECFFCRQCNKSLVDSEYLFKGDKIYCSTDCARVSLSS